MKVRLTLMCEVHCYNGSMKIDIQDDTIPIYTGQDLAPGPLRIDCMINWPTKINIFTSGKENNDTSLDINGHVLQDKAIEVVRVLVNNFPIQRQLTDKIFLCRRTGTDQVTNENWWGFNGHISIEFDQASPMRYMLSLQNQFDIDRSSESANG